MPSVTLKKDDISQNFTIGEHILGRGNVLQCISKRVSRKHSILSISADGTITLKSTHNNPCFHKSNESDNVSVITFGQTININNNDKIALSLDHGWFTVHVNIEQIPDDESNLPQTQALKRRLSNEGECSNKKSKPDETNNDTVTNVQIKTEPIDSESDSKPIINDGENITEVQTNRDAINETTLETNLSLPEVKVEPITSDESANIKTEPADKSTDEANTDCAEVKQELVIKEETDDTIKQNDNEDKQNSDNNANKPSTSGTNKRPWRDRCWYGSACYRKNGVHRVEFKHPGDSDFDSDSDDTRPICCYGAGCYRKNKDHRQRYRHPGQTKLGTKPPRTLRKRRTVKPKPPPQSLQDSEELDDYDYSDPFIYDGSEDEYEPSQETDTESEYEDSQEADEDHQRLFREARKFTRKNK